MATETDVCNDALVQILGEKRISSGGFATPTNERERVANESFASVRDAELRGNFWNFAMEWTDLAPDVWDGNVDYSYRYSWPADCLRIFDVSETRHFEVAGNKIYTNVGTEINVRYVKRITIPNSWDALFRPVMAAALAKVFCMRLTGLRPKLADAKDAYREAMGKAVQADAIENPTRAFAESDWISVRS